MVNKRSLGTVFLWLLLFYPSVIISPMKIICPLSETGKVGTSQAAVPQPGDWVLHHAKNDENMNRRSSIYAVAFWRVTPYNLVGVLSVWRNVVLMLSGAGWRRAEGHILLWDNLFNNWRALEWNTPVLCSHNSILFSMVDNFMKVTSLIYSLRRSRELSKTLCKKVWSRLMRAVSSLIAHFRACVVWGWDLCTHSFGYPHRKKSGSGIANVLATECLQNVK
jgi:hypothetical protein